MSVNAACGGYRPVPEFDPGETRRPVPLEGTPLTRLWQSRPVRGPFSPLAADSLNLYLGGSDRRVVAVDLASGRNRWSVRLPGPVVGGVLLAGTMVYAGTDQPGGRVHALQVASGGQAWSTGTGYVQAPLLLVDGRLIVLNRRGQILALDPASGKVAWRRPLPSTNVPPVAAGPGLVMVTSYDSLYLVRARDGNVLLRRHAPGTVVSPWVRLGRHFVAGTGDSAVIAIRADSLALAWRVHLDAPVLVSPAVLDDTLYCVTQVGTLYEVVAAAAPEVRVLREQPWPATGQPAVVGDWLLVGGADGTLHAFNRADGSEAWSVPLGRPAEIAPFPLPDGGFLALGGRGDLQRVTQ